MSEHHLACHGTYCATNNSNCPFKINEEQLGKLYEITIRGICIEIDHINEIAILKFEHGGGYQTIAVDIHAVDLVDEEEFT